jgi:CubicO group peptidase (beta-lactamase class C family)
MDIEGYLVEKLSGQSLPQFMHDQIFAPLGMKDAGFYVPAEKRARFATNYRNDQGKLVLTEAGGVRRRTTRRNRAWRRVAAGWFRPPRTTTALRRCWPTAASSTACASFRRKR